MVSEARGYFDLFAMVVVLRNDKKLQKILKSRGNAAALSNFDFLGSWQVRWIRRTDRTRVLVEHLLDKYLDTVLEKELVLA